MSKKYTTATFFGFFPDVFLRLFRIFSGVFPDVFNDFFRIFLRKNGLEYGITSETTIPESKSETTIPEISSETTLVSLVVAGSKKPRAG